jgi:hypothetical protein
MSRFGITPTGIRVTSFLDLTSNTETAFEPEREGRRAKQEQSRRAPSRNSRGANTCY